MARIRRPSGKQKVLEGKAIIPFREAMKSPLTRGSYERSLSQSLRRMGYDVDTFVEKCKADPNWAQTTILDYLMGLKEKVRNGEISAGTVANARKPIRLLLDMNDVVGINWRKISRFMPQARRYALDRAPTTDEVRLILSNADLRFQAIVLTMISSGIRLGAWDWLNWGHVQPVRRDEKTVAAKLTVYEGDPEEYCTFITPEAYEKLERYIKLREVNGEKVTPKSPLIRDRWEPMPHWGSYVGSINDPKRLQSMGVKRLIDDMLWKMGIRKEKKKRHEFSIHSFRKFFKTRAEQVMRPINVETMMGHSTGISDSYYRPTEKELLEDYLKAVPLLSISEAEEMKRVVLEEEGKNSEKIRRLEALVEELVAAKAQQALVLDRTRKSDT